MNATPMTFSQKWDATVSLEAQDSHGWTAFRYDMGCVGIGIGAVAITVGVIALAVFSGIIVSPEAAFTLGTFVGYVVGTLATRVAKPFYAWASYHYNLANQASIVREEYEQLRLNPRILCPKGKALSRIWKQNYASPTYNDFLQAKETSSNTHEHRKFFREKERDAAIKRVEYIFWKTLAKNNTLFEKVFLEHGTNAGGFIDAHNAISKFATWDSRSTDERLEAIYNRDLDSDILLTFNNPDIPTISYSAILRNDYLGFHERKFLEQDFIRALTNIPETREEAV